MTLNLSSDPSVAGKKRAKPHTDTLELPVFNATHLAVTLVHPFPRYGLAAALCFYSEGVRLAGMSEAQLREMLARAIEGGLNTFRMETESNPQIEDTLRFRHIDIKRLQADTALIQKAGLSAQGKYLFPSVVTSDGGAKGTFEEASKIVHSLRSGVALSRTQEMKRSFAPIMGEINNGSLNKTNEKGTLFEAACSAIATVTAAKPAAWTNQINTAIFPDLDLSHLREFVRIFSRLQIAGANRMEGKPSKKKEMRRPPLHDGNYPDAPREAAFGAVGLLAAMGYWATRAGMSRGETLEVLSVLESLSDTPLYLISYDGVHQAQFTHHVIGLAKIGKLRGILDSFYQDVRPYVVFEAPFLDHKLHIVRHLFFAFSGFLQRFDTPSFRNLLSIRAEYPPAIDLLLGEYFVEQQKIPRSIVESARALGQWINRTAYFVAEDDTPKETADRNKAVRKAKAKVLVEFESAIMSAVSPEDMLHRVSTRAGRLLQDDAPAKAQEFFDEAAIGELLTFKSAQHLLIAYLRLRSVKMPSLLAAEDVALSPKDEIDESSSDFEPKDVDSDK